MGNPPDAADVPPDARARVDGPAGLPVEVAPGRLIGQLRLAVALLVGLILAGAVQFSLVTREAALERAMTGLDQVSALMADGMERLIEATDQTLVVALEAVRESATSARPDGRLADLLRGAITGLPLVNGVIVTDETGTVRHASNPRPPPGIRIDERETFQTLRDRPGIGLHVGEPTESRVDGTRILPLARRIERPDGGFGGIVSSAIRLDALEALYAASLLHPDGGAILLVRQDGTVLARHPRVTVDATAQADLARRLARDAGTPSALTREPGAFDGAPRLFAHCRLHGGMLTLVVSVRETDVLAPWRREVTLVGTLAGGGLVILFGLLWLLERQVRRRTAAGTALRDSLARLQLRSAELSAIFDGTPVALCVVDRALCYTEANARYGRLLRRPPSALIGRPMGEVYTSLAAPMRALVSRALETGESIDNREIRLDTASKSRWALMSLRVLRDEAGGVVGAALAFQEITDLKRVQAARQALEADLRRTDRLVALGELTGGLAHDFNNLLTIMLGNLELLETMAESDESARELVGECREAARRGGALTGSLLAFARRQPLAPQPVDVNALVESMAALLRRTLGEQVQVRLELKPGLPPAQVDRAQLEAALTHLAANARDAMPRGGALTITTGLRQLDEAPGLEIAAGDYVVLSVADEGVGMTAEARADLFEPYAGAKGRRVGTGLGLSMVYGFVKQSGGHIAVESEPGRGSRFDLFLPGTAARPARAPVAAATVLVVEDDDALRRIAARQIAALGYAVREAAGADEALALLERGERIDVVFSDIVMPGRLDGHALAAQVAARWPGVRVLLTTGHAALLSEPGADDARPATLLKPWRRDALATALRGLLERPDAA